MPIKDNKLPHSYTAGMDLKPARFDGSHLIKIGVKTSNGGKDFPSAVRGFFIVRNNHVQGKNKIPNSSVFMAREIDYGLMQRLGYGAESIHKGLAKMKECTPDLLPDQLEFVLLNNTRRDENGRWIFEHTTQDSFECYSPELSPEDKKSWPGQHRGHGLFCHGDGECAMRKTCSPALPGMTEPVMTKKKIPCVPRGTNDDPTTWCYYSVTRQCKVHSAIQIMLTRRNENGVPVPLADTHNVRFHIDSSSSGCLRRVRTAINEASKILDGKIAGIRGMLRVQNDSVLQPNGKPGLTPQIYFELDQFQIANRANGVDNLLAANPVPLQITSSEPAEPRHTPMAALEHVEDAEVEAPEHPPEAQPATQDAEKVKTSAPENLGPVGALETELYNRLWATARAVDPENPEPFIQEIIQEISESKKLVPLAGFYQYREKDPGRHARGQELLTRVAVRLERIAAEKLDAVEENQDDIFDGEQESAPWEE